MNFRPACIGSRLNPQNVCLAANRWVARAARQSAAKGVQRAHSAWQAMTHFFNHQTYNRGQATTLLMQVGVDVGVTDLVVLL